MDRPRDDEQPEQAEPVAEPTAEPAADPADRVENVEPPHTDLLSVALLVFFVALIGIVGALLFVTVLL
jgi:hypothetical protein